MDQSVAPGELDKSNKPALRAAGPLGIWVELDEFIHAFVSVWCLSACLRERKSEIVNRVSLQCITTVDIG